MAIRLTSCMLSIAWYTHCLRKTLWGSQGRASRPYTSQAGLGLVLWLYERSCSRAGCPVAFYLSLIRRTFPCYSLAFYHSHRILHTAIQRRTRHLWLSPQAVITSHDGFFLHIYHYKSPFILYTENATTRGFHSLLLPDIRYISAAPFSFGEAPGHTAPAAAIAQIGGAQHRASFRLGCSFLDNRANQNCTPLSPEACGRTENQQPLSRCWR